MIQVSVSDIQKNPKVLSQSEMPVEVIDKRKKVSIGVFYPRKKKNSKHISLAGVLGQYVTEDKKNISWEEIRSKTQRIRQDALQKKYSSKKK